MNLGVYFGGRKAGNLFSTASRGVVFAYDEEYLSDSASQGLSASLPLRKEEFSQKECLPFFSGLLPEGDSRKKISDYLHISETSTLKLLAALGGECAGLITLTAEENPVLQREWYEFNGQNYEELSNERLADFIRKIPERPLIKADDKLRLSLAGAQEKIALAQFGGRWYLPLNGAPSTHILKPTREGSLSSLAQNEYICLRLANELAITVPGVDLISIAGKDVLVVNRYDRIIQGNNVCRLHQEDFCQALGLMSEVKYQSDGGPGIADICTAMKSIMTVPAIEIQKLFHSVVFNYLIGNCDCHGKNYSILYNGRKTELAPLYDIVSTTLYEGLTDKLSMKIGRHYEIEKVSQEDFLLLADSMNMKISLCKAVFKTYAEKLPSAFAALSGDNRIDGDVLARIRDGVNRRMQKLVN